MKSRCQLVAGFFHRCVVQVKKSSSYSPSNSRMWCCRSI